MKLYGNSVYKTKSIDDLIESVEGAKSVLAEVEVKMLNIVERVGSNPTKQSRDELDILQDTYMRLQGYIEDLESYIKKVNE